jgi:hypothetical protein
MNVETGFNSTFNADSAVEFVLEHLLDSHGNLKPDFDLIASLEALLAELYRQPREVGAFLLAQLSKRLGNDQFPVFIKMLCTVGQSQDSPAKRVVCNALSQSIRDGDVPSGALTSWGIPHVWSAQVEHDFSPPGFAAPKRQLDPLSYLVTWFSQTTNRQLLQQEIYVRLLTELLLLFEGSPVCSQLYQTLVVHQVTLLPPGTFQQATQLRLERIVAGWESGMAPAEIAQSSLQDEALSINLLMGR